jgi:hypothetical protein
MSPVVYDAGVLIAADRNVRHVWAEHRARLEAGVVPLVPAPVLAQVSRSSRQASLRRFLRGCEIVAFDEPAAHRAGALLSAARTQDVIDAAVVELAARSRADIISDDARDLRKLLSAARVKVRVIGV